MLIGILSGSTLGQVKIMAKPGEICHLDEVGAIVLLKDDKIKVEFVMPTDKRAKAYMNVDIKNADEILMVNGQKVKTPEDIEVIYKALNVGEEFKLGIRRDGNLMIVSYNKADPDDLPKKKMMKLKVVDEGDGVKKSIVDDKGNEHTVEGDSVEINGKKMSLKEIKENSVQIKVNDDDEI
jgi:hypothetical protein